MKRLLCLLLCMTLWLPALADSTDDLPRLFNAQFITGGGGVRGKATITASGTAEWLDLLLPFTATDLWFRAIGVYQGGKTNVIHDDDDWQVQFYTQDDAGEKHGSTWLFSNGENICLTGELLPEITLKLPSQGVHLLYDLARADASKFIFGFDMFGLKDRSANGRPAVYESVADIIGVDEETWAADWAPVLQKYELDMDLWLAGYAKTTSSTDEKGLLTMSTTYTIPADAAKKQAKYLIGQMIFDNDLQNLLVPLVTPEERSVYLNPNLVYFYEACIDALSLNGDILLKRNLNARGEVLSTEISLPLPVLPGALTAPLNELLTKVFALPYDALTDLQRISWNDEGEKETLSLICKNRTLTVDVKTQSVAEDNTVTREGSLQLIPEAGVNEVPLFAAFCMTTGKRVYESDDYRIHDVKTFALEMKPDETLTSGQPFDPFAVSFTADYHTKANFRSDPVQINLGIDIDTATADVSASILLRTMSGWEHTTLSDANAIDVRFLTDAQKVAIRELFVKNAAQMVISLTAEPTAVPPMDNGQ